MGGGVWSGVFLTVAALSSLRGGRYKLKACFKDDGAFSYLWEEILRAPPRGQVLEQCFLNGACLGFAGLDSRLADVRLQDDGSAFVFLAVAVERAPRQGGGRVLEECF